jgi:hypothetical protein
MPFRLADMTATSLNKVLEVLDAEADSSSSFSDAAMLPQPAKGNEARSARAAMNAHRKVHYYAIFSADTIVQILLAFVQLAHDLMI